jgi:CSLREA domain-containing protein
MFRYLTHYMVLITLLHFAGQALSASFTVTRFDDPTPNNCLITDCSLREAVIAANLLAGADSIVLAQGTYLLSQTTGISDAERDDLDISDTVSITGLGSTQTLIRNSIVGPAPNRRIFDLTSTLHLQQLALRDGDTRVGGLFFEGGCVRAVSSRLSMTEVLISNCKSVGGGAISLRSSTAHFKKVDITSNLAEFGGAILAGNSTLRGSDVRLSNNLASIGGALWISPDGILPTTRLEWATGSQIVANRATYHGGGIAVVQGANLIVAPQFTTSALDDLLFVSANQAGGDGGGIYLGSTAALDATRIGLRHNVSDSSGGGLYAVVGSLSLSDSELFDNSAALDGGGAAIRGLPSPSTIQRSSFAFNLAGRYGGAISNSADGFSLRNISSYRNVALSGGAVDVAANTRILHFSSLDDSASNAGSLRLTANALLQNSVMSNGCTSFGGFVIDLGGNAQAFGLPACAGGVFSGVSLGLDYGYAGGRFNVVRITTPASVLVDLAIPSALAASDIRNWLRLGAFVDSGAFEFAAVP